MFKNIGNRPKFMLVFGGSVVAPFGNATVFVFFNASVLDRERPFFFQA